MSKYEEQVAEILKDSQVRLVIRKHPLSGEVNYVRIRVFGAAGKIPSVSNNRLNMFPKKGISDCLENIIKAQSFTNARTQAIRAQAALKKANVVSTINPAFKVKLDALTRLWRSVPKPDYFPLKCDNENRWLVTIHCHKELNRIDTHNLTKGVCDWLQDCNIIKNDKDVDCWPMRNDDWIRETPELGALTISLKPLRELGGEISALIKTMTT